MLRPYQQAIVDRIAAELLFGNTKIVVQSVPGSGKTRIGTYLAIAEAKRGSPVLWIAAREELVDQAHDTICEFYGASVGRITATDEPSASLIQVASLQTLLARNSRPPAGLVVVDEMRHLTLGNQWGTILDAYKDAVVIGLDATPINGTGSALRADVMIHGPSVRELINLGYLVEPNIIYPGKQLPPKTIAQRPVDAYKKYANGKQALVFAQNSIAAKEHLLEFRAYGIDAEFISFETPNRDVILDKFKRGELTVLINQNILTEGFDYPALECVILARKCGTDEIYVQITSRALRASPGKTTALILDLAGNAFAFGSPVDDRTYVLGGTSVIRNGVKMEFRFCMACGAVLISVEGSVCPDCTAMGVTIAQLKAPRVTGDKLQKFAGINKRPTEDRKSHYFRMMRELENRGKDIRAAYHKYKSIYSKPDGTVDEPPYSWLVEYRTSPQRYMK